GGAKKYFGSNPPDGVTIFYTLNGKPEKASLKVLDYAGQTVRDLQVRREPGLQKVQWDLTRPSLQTAFNLQAGRELPEEAIRRPGGLFGRSVAPGVYRLV